MYRSITDKEYKKYFSLPEDYKVKGLLSFGSWDKEKNISELEQVLIKRGTFYTSRFLSGPLFNVLEIKINNKNYWFVVVYGGTMLSEYIHLACLFGSKKNIHIGSCGGLNPEAESFDLIIPTWSYGNESITRIYDRKSEDFKHYSDENLSNLFEHKLKEKKFNIKKGPIVTNQAMMAETFDDIKLWSNQGYYGVEMETSTVFSVSNHFNVPSTAVLYVSDNLINRQTVLDGSYFNQKTEIEKIKRNIFDISLDILTS